jgi:hypothetical protein
MSSFDPQLAMLAAITSAIVYTMIAAGIAKKQLRWRRPRRCPTCGGTPCHCRLRL